MDHPRCLCARPSVSQYFVGFEFQPTETNAYSVGGRLRREMLSTRLNEMVQTLQYRLSVTRKVHDAR